MRQRSLIAVTLFVSLILLISSFGLLSAASTTFGETSPGSYSAWQSGGTMIASRFTASAGTPSSMSVFITQSSSISNTIKGAIYAESTKQLVAVTEEKNVPAGSNGWLTFNFGSSPPLTSGASYSLVVWFKNSGSTIHYRYGNTIQSWYAHQSYSSFPNGPYNYFGGYGQEHTAYSIYCTLSSSTIQPQTTTSTSSSASSTSIIGQTSKGSNIAWQPANVMVGSRFTAPSSGTINSIAVYITNGASVPNYARCAVYSETNKGLLATSQELTINAQSAGWFTFPISAALNAGQRYSLVVGFKNSNSYLSYASGSSSQSWYTSSSYGNFPSTYNAWGQESNVYSIYATMNSQSTSTTTPTYSNPTPSPQPIPTSTAKGELYLWVGWGMSAGDSNAQKIANARDTYGVPIWIDTGNWGYAQLTSSYINYFHSHGVKVVDRLYSKFGSVPLDTILHSMTPTGLSRGSVDYQLSIGPEIDAFMIDECDPYNRAYYEAIANYVHSKGKLLFVNPGGPNVRDTYTYADKVSVEYCWWGLINDSTKQSILANNPQKFIGVSKDYGYSMDPIYDPYIAPRYASGDRPAWYAPMSLERAVWDVKTAWNGGVYCASAQPADASLPYWWSQFVSNLRY